MSDPVLEHLEHHGIKGMKWGQRKDKKWQANIYSVRGAVAVHNAVAERMNNGGLDKLNNQPKYKNATKLIDLDTGQPVGALGKQYMRDYNKMAERFSHEAVAEVHGTSPSGGFKATMDTSNPNQWSVKVVKTEAAHAVLANEDFIFEVDHDRRGMITSTKLIKDGLKQDNLEHHGVKGMKWGVRRKVGSNGRVSSKKQPSVDFKTTAPLRKRPPHTLSNMQLKKVTERMNLEKKFSDMNPSRAAKGKEAVNKMLQLGTGAVGVGGLVKLATHEKTRELGRKALTIDYTKKWSG